jgi:mevalonate kinase
MKSCYRASAKLLISGEYLVMKGAGALAVPLKRGQSMEVEATEDLSDPSISWEARVLGNPWFHAVIRLPDMEIAESDNSAIAANLRHILSEARKLNSAWPAPETRFSVITQSDFDHAWGLGSSSALIANIAQWAGIDPMALCSKVSNGSCYDVATALAPGPIRYRLEQGMPVAVPVTFMPPYRNNLWFVYLGQKQDTRGGIAGFLSNALTQARDIEIMNELTEGFLAAPTLDAFLQVMQQHEILMAGILKMKRIKESLFHDFIGEIKSLGTWGGDFALAATPMPDTYVKTYFALKGLTRIFGFDELIRFET